MKANPALLFFLCAITFLQSCATIYHPGVQNIPLLKEKGEVKLSATVNDYQGAYAVTNHIGIMVNARQMSQRPFQGFHLIPDRVDNKMLEIGAGYFAQGEKNWTSEIYAGAGVSVSGLIHAEQRISTYRFPGDTSRLPEYDSYFYDVQTRAARYFLQSSVGFASKYVDVAFSTRVVGLKWKSVNILHNGVDAVDYPGFRVLKFSMFAEPAVTIQAGYKSIKIRLQTGLSLCMDRYFKGNQVTFGSIGLVGDIGKWYQE